MKDENLELDRMEIGKMKGSNFAVGDEIYYLTDVDTVESSTVKNIMIESDGLTCDLEITLQDGAQLTDCDQFAKTEFKLLKSIFPDWKNIIKEEIL